MIAGLADLLAQGATAEAMCRVAAQLAEADWQENLTVYGDPATSELDRAIAYGKLLGILPYRSLFTAALEIWERQTPAPPNVVTIHSPA